MASLDCGTNENTWPEFDADDAASSHGNELSPCEGSGMERRKAEAEPFAEVACKGPRPDSASAAEALDNLVVRDRCSLRD